MHLPTSDDRKKDRSLLDYVLYILAGGVIAAISFSFLLWLRF